MNAIDRLTAAVQEGKDVAAGGVFAVPKINALELLVTIGGTILVVAVLALLLYLTHRWLLSMASSPTSRCRRPRRARSQSRSR